MRKISIVTDPDYFPDQTGCFGISHRFAKEYMQTARDREIEFITPAELVGRTDLVRRVIDRTLHYDSTVERMHSQLSEGGAHYLNHPSAMDLLASKAKLYEALGGLENHLIPTAVLVGLNDIKHFIASKVGQKICIKPEYGGMGNKVFFVHVIGANRLCAEWMEDEKRCFEGSVDEFYTDYMCGEEVKHDRKNALAKTRWIGQDFVQFSKVQEGVVDIRLIHQATTTETKRQAALYGRRAATNISITNLEKGGQIVSIDEVLGEAQIRIAQILELCDEVERIIEAQTGHVIGEIGHDIGITASGRLFYIEGNTMPGYVYSNWGAICSDQSIGFTDLPELDRMLVSTPLDYLLGLE